VAVVHAIRLRPKCAIRARARPIVRCRPGLAGPAPPPAALAPSRDHATSLCPRPTVALAPRPAACPRRVVATPAAARPIAMSAAGPLGPAARLVVAPAIDRARAPSCQHRVAVRAPRRRRPSPSTAMPAAARSTASLAAGRCGLAARLAAAAVRSRVHARSRRRRAVVRAPSPRRRKIKTATLAAALSTARSTIGVNGVRAR
jgi:hypothetical protein